MGDMNGVKVSTERDGRTRYEVQGSDGWKLVTHDEDIARRESSKKSRHYGSVRVHY